MEKTDVKSRLSGALRLAAKSAILIFAIMVLFYYLGGRHQSRQSASHQAASSTTPVSAPNFGNVVPYRISEFEQAVAVEKRPVILFIYTSWCKYCRMEFPLVNAAAKNHADEFAFYAVSIDKEPEKLSAFLARQNAVNFKPYNIESDEDQLEIETSFKHYGLTFDGSFPYIAIFMNGKSVGEMKGALEKADFDAMLADVRAEAARAKAASMPEAQQTSIQQP